MSSEEFKVILVGDSGVGKTSFIVRYSEGWFQDVYEGTLGADCRKIQLVAQDTNVELNLWDTAGQERFRHIVSRFYRSADGAIVMYDITRKSSFDSVPFWIDDVKKKCGTIPIVLVGNKFEDAMKVEVLEELVQDFVDDHHMLSFKASAKNNKNVHQVFESLATRMLSEREAIYSDNEHTRLWPADHSSQPGATSNIRLGAENKKTYCCISLESRPSGLII